MSMTNSPFQVDEDNRHHAQVSRTAWWLGMVWPINLQIYLVLGMTIVPSVLAGICGMVLAFVVAGCFETRCDTKAAVVRYAAISSTFAIVAAPLIASMTSEIMTFVLRR